jgi:ElaB/YqjD/DUF883 family membrane-anchored ribosome-binding protein
MRRVNTLTKLVNDVEELLGELKDEHGPEVQELRARVEEALDATRHALRQQSTNATARIGRYASSVDGYIHDYPRVAFLTGACIFGTIGYLAGAMGRARD